MERLVVDWNKKFIGGTTKGCSGFKRQIDALQDTFNKTNKDFCHFEKVPQSEDMGVYRYNVVDDTLKLLCSKLNVRYLE